MDCIPLTDKANLSTLMVEHSLALILDDAWQVSDLPLPHTDLRTWGPRLRFCAPEAEMQRFYEENSAHWPAFLLSGSGDFHHLSALFLRRMKEPCVLISFDNHPDWDIRPPRWCAGSWVSRALENPLLQKAAIWGPASFECWGFWKIFANKREIRKGRLEAYPWVDHRPEGKRTHPGAITRENWRERFTQFVTALPKVPVYVTVDIDSLRAEDAVTNWEPGRFQTEDIIWALQTLRHHTEIVAGDLCGAWSPESYVRWRQCFCGNLDHPKLTPPDPRVAREKNLKVLRAIWPALTGITS